jgi:hypothetical protein
MPVQKTKRTPIAMTVSRSNAPPDRMCPPRARLVIAVPDAITTATRPAQRRRSARPIPAPTYANPARTLNHSTNGTYSPWSARAEPMLSSTEPPA